MNPAKFERAKMSAVDEFKKLAMEEREKLAFETCGCEVAYPTWWMNEDGSTEQVDCVHLGCQIRRGEYRRPEWSVRLNAHFRGELRGGWLRFCKESTGGRLRAAKLYRAMREAKRFDIMSAVHVGIMS